MGFSGGDSLSVWVPDPWSTDLLQGYGVSDDLPTSDRSGCDKWDRAERKGRL